MIFDAFVQVALLDYDIREHFFGLRAAGDTPISGPPLDQVLANLAMMVCFRNHFTPK
jgi:hypothetical protein